MSPELWQPFSLSFQLAFLSTAILLVVALPIALALEALPRWSQPAVEAVIALPIVLPPSVLGFYLLLFMSPQGLLGSFTAAMGLGSLNFTFSGLVIGSVCYSLPFVVQPVLASLREIHPDAYQTASSLGISPLKQVRLVTLPLCRRGFFTGGILGFAHTLGEFGVVLMIGGNIPGETKVVSIAIYDHVETLAYQEAHTLSFILLLIATSILWLTKALEKQWGTRP